MRQLLLAVARRLPPGLLRRIGAWQWTGPLARRFVTASSQWIRHGDVTIAHGAAAGLRFNASGANAGYALGTSEPQVQDAIQRYVRAGAVAYDIGANVGFFSVLLGRLVGPAGAVFAFEPVHETARSAQRNVDLNGFAHVHIRQEAVGRQAGSV